jgi:hypothetical protein
MADEFGALPMLHVVFNGQETGYAVIIGLLGCSFDHEPPKLWLELRLVAVALIHQLESSSELRERIVLRISSRRLRFTGIL